MASLTASTQQKPIQWIKSTLISVNQRSKFDWIRATKVAANKRLTPLVHFQSPLNNSSICFLFGCVDVSRFCLHRPRNKTTAKQKKNVFPSMPTKLPDNSLPRLLKKPPKSTHSTFINKPKKWWNCFPQCQGRGSRVLPILRDTRFRQCGCLSLGSILANCSSKYGPYYSNCYFFYDVLQEHDMKNFGNVTHN